MNIRSLTTAIAILAASAIPAGAAIRYRAEPGIDPQAQLAEMLQLYEDICLTAFPDEAGVAKAIARLRPTPMTGSALSDIFHGDPGLGWVHRGQSATFEIGLEAPPFHACSIRTMTAAGFADLATYRALADAYEARVAGFHPFAPADMRVGNVRTIGVGESKQLPDGSADALMVFLVTPADAAARKAGDSGMEVRFVHQMASPPRQ